MLARYGGPIVSPLARFRAARWIMFRQIVGRPSAMSALQARRAIADMGKAPGFGPTMRASLPRSYTARRAIDVPVSVSFGTRDCLLLPHQSRHIEQLPARTRVVPLGGTGHVPMTDDPTAVAALIRETVEASRGPQPFDVP